MKNLFSNYSCRYHHHGHHGHGGHHHHGHGGHHHGHGGWGPPHHHHHHGPRRYGQGCGCFGCLLPILAIAGTVIVGLIVLL